MLKDGHPSARNRPEAVRRKAQRLHTGKITPMNQALSLKFAVQGLEKAAAIPLIDDAVSGDDWQYGFTFADGSSMSVHFSASGTAGVEQCLIDCYDEQGNPMPPVVRTRFTCKYLNYVDCVEAYYDGTTFAGHPLPYFTLSDVWHSPV